MGVDAVAVVKQARYVQANLVASGFINPPK